MQSPSFFLPPHSTSQTSPQTWSPQRLNFHSGTSTHTHSLLQQKELILGVPSPGESFLCLTLPSLAGTGEGGLPTGDQGQTSIQLFDPRPSCTTPLPYSSQIPNPSQATFVRSTFVAGSVFISESPASSNQPGHEPQTPTPKTSHSLWTLLLLDRDSPAPISPHPTPTRPRF